MQPVVSDTLHARRSADTSSLPLVASGKRAATEPNRCASTVANVPQKTANRVAMKCKQGDEGGIGHLGRVFDNRLRSVGECP